MRGKGDFDLKKIFNSPLGIVLILMLISNFVNGDFSNPGAWFLDKLMILPGIIVGLSFHEFAHAAMSNALGDPTPKMQGRLTINPRAHIDPFGFIALMFCGFGWGVPVEIDPRYYKHRRRDELLVSVAGVVMNLIIAVAFGVILRILFKSMPNIYDMSWGETLVGILVNVVMINIILMIFNLLPVPPLDGFGIITEIFNLRKYEWYYNVYEKGYLILLALIIFNVTDYILTPGANFVFDTIVRFIIF